MCVHHPLDYNQSMSDPSGVRNRLLKYLVPVILLSILVNIPKFFETQAWIIDPVLLTAAVNNNNNNNNNFTSSSIMMMNGSSNSNPSEEAEVDGEGAGFKVFLNVTEMRIHPIYSSYVNWSQLIYLGVVPVFLLVYFNTKIYQDIRERENRWGRASYSARASQNQPKIVVVTQDDGICAENGNGMETDKNGGGKSGMVKTIFNRLGSIRSARSNREQNGAGSPDESSAASDHHHHQGKSNSGEKESFYFS